MCIKRQTEKCEPIFNMQTKTAANDSGIQSCRKQSLLNIVQVVILSDFIIIFIYVINSGVITRVTWPQFAGHPIAFSVRGLTVRRL